MPLKEGVLPRLRFRRDFRPWWSRIRSVASALADLAFPRRCASCEISMLPELPGRYLCWDCRGRVEYHSVRTFCDRCGRSFEGAMTLPFTCSACRDHPPAFDAARSAAHFRDPVRGLLLDFKYHGATWLCDDLTDLLEACVANHFTARETELVCPVPLHPRRKRERGYNQAELLAKSLARRLEVPCFSDALRRVRYTGTQTKLDAAQRRSNAAGAFAVSPLIAPWLSDRSVLLVDDVMTTGATVSDAARALRQAGVRRVQVVTVARD